MGDSSYFWIGVDNNMATQYEYKHESFQNTPSGRKKKIRRANQLGAEGWEIDSETITGTFDLAKAGCGASCCGPCGALQGRQSGMIQVRFKRSTDNIPITDDSKTPDEIGEGYSFKNGMLQPETTVTKEKKPLWVKCGIFLIIMVVLYIVGSCLGYDMTGAR